MSSKACERPAFRYSSPLRSKNEVRYDKTRRYSTSPLCYSSAQKVVIDMKDKPAPEYIHLFRAITKTIESLQELLIMQVVAKSAIEEAGNIPDQPSKFLLRAYDEQIAALQVMQAQCFSLALNARKKEKPRL